MHDVSEGDGRQRDRWSSSVGDLFQSQTDLFFFSSQDTREVPTAVPFITVGRGTSARVS